MSWIKTSKTLSSPDKPAFRIEKKKIYDETFYDLIWQANGKEEEIFMLVGLGDLEDLKHEINKVLTNSN